MDNFTFVGCQLSLQCEYYCFKVVCFRLSQFSLEYVSLLAFKLQLMMRSILFKSSAQHDTFM